MDVLSFASTYYVSLREKLREEDPQIDERTLTDTLEGVTDIVELLTGILRGALEDEALVNGLTTRIDEMEERLERFRDRASKRRQLVKETMIAVDLKKLVAPDFTASIRAGIPALTVLDEGAVPSIYWEPREPRLKRQDLLADLKQGTEIAGVTLSGTEPSLSVRTK